MIYLITCQDHKDCCGSKQNSFTTRPEHQPPSIFSWLKGHPWQRGVQSVLS